MGVDRWRRQRAARRPSFTLEISGAQDLEAALMELPKAVAKAVVRRVLKKVLEPIANMARSLVHVKSGRVKAGIAVSTKLSKRQKRRNKVPKGDIQAFVGASPAKAAHLLEFGTEERFTKSGKSTGAARAFPFLRPAWAAGWRGALDDIGRSLWKEIDKSRARIAKRRAKKSMRIDF